MRNQQNAPAIDLSFIPPITRYYFITVAALSLLSKFGVVNPYTLVLYWTRIYENFEIWRLLTSALFLPVNGFTFLLNLYFLYSYSTECEKIFPNTRPDKYLHLLIFNWGIITIAALFLGGPLLLCPTIIMCLIYIWSRYKPDIIVQFWFGIKFKAVYFPFVLTALHVILGDGGITGDVLGILSGHLYYSLAEIFPREFRSTNRMGISTNDNFLPYPDIFKGLVERIAGRQVEQGGFYAGHGQRLG